MDQEDMAQAVGEMDVDAVPTIDDIDVLVDYELTLPKYSSPYKFSEPCKFCEREWHGLPKDDCPGLVTR